jgi:hemoglobin-like flavoprotein
MIFDTVARETDRRAAMPRDRPMTPEHILLVQATFDEILPTSSEVAIHFYQRLFELNPALRLLFPNDMRRQQDMLMAMINAIVNDLWHSEALVPVLQQLGQRHVMYGVQAVHYDVVGAVLLWTLRQHLGTQFTAEVEAAWLAAYTFIATTMLAGIANKASTSEPSIGLELPL